MLAPLLLLLIGTGDLIRAVRLAALRWTLLALLWAAVAAAAVAGLGVGALQVAALVALHVGWLAAMPVHDRPTPRRLWPAFALIVLIAVDAVFDLGRGTAGPLLDWYDDTVPAVNGIDAATALGALGVAAFLTRSANLVVRAALRRATTGEPLPSRPGGWDVRVAGRSIAEVDRRTPAPAVGTRLKGGRIIGPLERLLLVLLALAGQAPVIAALVAAKGIVRFPEISEDRGSGSKAEEFLVGSLTSWSLAAGSGVLLWALHIR